MTDGDVSKSQAASADVTDYSVDSAALDVATTDETYWDFPEAQQNIGYYKSEAQLKKAIDALADWTTGRGYTTDTNTEVILEHITGNGKDTINTILWNMLVMKKVIGDSFAEIIIKDGVLINLKPISAERMRVVYSKNGKIKRYEYKNMDGKGYQTFKPSEILHIQNDRIGDEIHGNSVIDACKWVIDALGEARTDYRKVLHRNVVPLRIIEVDTNKQSELNQVRDNYKTLAKGEADCIVIPKGTVAVTTDQIKVQDPIGWITALEDYFYKAVGVPKVILGGADTYTEAASKVGYMTFDQVWMSEQAELEMDLWNQLGISIKFERPQSIAGSMQTSDAKNTGQVNFQPKDTTATLTGE